MKNNQTMAFNLEGVKVIIVLLAFLLTLPMRVNAQDRTESVQVKTYEFGDDSKYEITNAIPLKIDETLGSLKVSGDFKKEGDDKEPRYDVRNSNLTVTYLFDKTIIENPKEKWHLYDDGTKSVDGIDLEDKIGSGVIIIQTSLDKKKWVTDLVKTNAFTVDYDSSEPLLTTKDIQLINGCYYRIIVAYEQEIVTGSSQIWMVSLDDKQYRKKAEVYEFYAENSSEKALSDANSTPRKELGEKVCVKSDTGYSQIITMDHDNPHYGWDLGTFSINGYTRESLEDGKPLFLKNAGDKVTLWFKLLQDIDDLGGKGTYYIADDKNGSDQYFEVPMTDLKRGSLIIRFTDHEGVKHDPVIYTDFLAADATTGANTKAVLFEEGDYEVALDYTIREKGFWGSENDYRIFFEFSIRNGNTMFFPFDLSTGAELRDKSIAPEGFTTDMAKSRYLYINVTRTAIVKNQTGHSEDVRFNGPAKDGAKYTEEGVYTVDVTNRYTGEHTLKTFFVGSDPFMIAMAKSGKTVKELDDFLSQGYAIESDGSLVAPPEPEEEVVEESVEQAKVVEKEILTIQNEIETTAVPVENNEKLILDTNDMTEAEVEPETETGNQNKIILLGSLLISGVLIGLVTYKKKTIVSTESDLKKPCEEHVNISSIEKNAEDSSIEKDEVMQNQEGDE